MFLTMKVGDLQILFPKRKAFNGNATRHFSQYAASRAPNATINIKHIRENPELYYRSCLDRNYKAQSDNPSKIVKLFDRWKKSQIDSSRVRERRNDINAQLSQSRTSSGVEGEEDPDGHDKHLLKEAQDLKKLISDVDEFEEDIKVMITELATELPNLTSKETPRGGRPEVLEYINEHLNPPSISHNRSHVDIGTDFDLINFSGGATTSGWGWYFLHDEAADLEHALVQYALKVAKQHGFKHTSPPSMIYTYISSACGFKPRDQNGEQQVYDIQQVEKDLEKRKPTMSLAGTAEIPLAGEKTNSILDPADLPIRVVGSSRCFRAEAGARGVATKGLYRVHEFTKVEMFAWTAPGKEEKTFRSMLAVQTEILQSLGLHCRVLEMPTHDLGASAFRKIDIEAFFPSRRQTKEGWGEVTSTSICTDYQSRRLNTRVRKGAASEAKMDFPSTINGTALAVPRVLAALLEYGWDEKEVCVRIPEVLWPWMHGIKVIKKKH